MTEPTLVQAAGVGFSVTKQEVLLDISLASRQLLEGQTQITIVPENEDLKAIQLNCRQCKISKVLINDKQTTTWTYYNPYEDTKLHGKVGVNQYHLLEQKLSDAEDLVIHFPKSVKPEPIDPASIEAETIILSNSVNITKKDGVEDSAIDLSQPTKTSINQFFRFKPLTIKIYWAIDEFREGLNFVGWEEGDLHYPHAYTTGKSQSLFPCVDTLGARCTWDIKLRYASTLGNLRRGMLNQKPEENDWETQDLCAVALGEERIYSLSGRGNDDHAPESSAVSYGELQFRVNVSSFQLSPTSLTTTASRSSWQENKDLKVCTGHPSSRTSRCVRDRTI